jgi:hypothetical protein
MSYIAVCDRCGAQEPKETASFKNYALLSAEELRDIMLNKLRMPPDRLLCPSCFGQIQAIFLAAIAVPKPTEEMRITRPGGVYTATGPERPMT